MTSNARRYKNWAADKMQLTSFDLEMGDEMLARKMAAEVDDVLERHVEQTRTYVEIQDNFLNFKLWYERSGDWAKLMELSISSLEDALFRWGIPNAHQIRLSIHDAMDPVDVVTRPVGRPSSPDAQIWNDWLTEKRKLKAQFNLNLAKREHEAQAEQATKREWAMERRWLTAQHQLDIATMEEEIRKAMQG
jgi:hypothetical protein